VERPGGNKRRVDDENVCKMVSTWVAFTILLKME